MTRVNVTFEAPEPRFGVELNVHSQAAWDRWERAQNNEETSARWDDFLCAFESQMDSYMGNGCIQEVYEDNE
jgi:hypothetical protein